jgi:hypothetical protein
MAASASGGTSRRWWPFVIVIDGSLKGIEHDHEHEQD